MEKITEKYYLGSNKNTFILYEKRVSQTTGKESFKNIGYFSSLEVLYSTLIEKEVREDLNVMQNMNKITDLIKELRKFTKQYINK